MTRSTDRSLSPAQEPINAELAKWLSPGNENVKQGYTIAMIRDLAQAKISAFDNVKEQEVIIARLSSDLAHQQEQNKRNADELDVVAAALSREVSLRVKAEADLLRLRSALQISREFMDHQADCELQIWRLGRSDWNNGKEPPCTCGYAAFCEPEKV